MVTGVAEWKRRAVEAIGEFDPRGFPEMAERLSDMLNIDGLRSLEPGDRPAVIRVTLFNEEFGTEDGFMVTVTGSDWATTTDRLANAIKGLAVVDRFTD